MIRNTLLVALAVGLTASAARAQTAKIEISANAGWTFSDGVTGPSTPVPGIGTFDRVDPKNAFSWGLRGAYLLNRNAEVGFLFDLQSTQLNLGGTETVKLGDLNVYNYHGYFAYSFGDRSAPARPYFLVGLGATQYGGVSASLGDTQQKLDGGTKFSGTVALGAKVFPFATPKFGLRAEARFTPTYIKSDPGGWWCGYWGCYVVDNLQYANQIELLGGIILRL